MFFTRRFRTVPLICLIATAANAQIRLHWGVEAGIPLTDTLSSYSISYASGADYSLDRYNSITKRLLIGPCLRLELPKGLALEFDAIYQRVNYDVTNVASYPEIPYFSESFEQIHANRWQFPLLVQYSRQIRKRNYFVEVGPSISTFVNAKGKYSSSFIEPPAVPVAGTGGISGQAGTLAGITTGAGMDIPLFHKRLRPEFRYSHWFSANSAATGGSAFFLTTGTFYEIAPIPYESGSGFRANPNEVSFLLGLTF